MVPLRSCIIISAVLTALPLPAAAQGGNSVTIRFGEDEHIVIEKSNLKPADKKLFLAAIDGDVAGIDAAVKEGGNVNVRDMTGETPLWHMAAAGNRAVVEALIRHGANVNYRHRERGNNSVLSIAISHGRAEIAELLLNSRAKPVGEMDLMRAIYNKWDNLAFLMIKKGAPVKVRDQAGNTPLIACIDNRGNIDLIRLLVKKGVKINAKAAGDYTALHYAVLRNNHEAVGLLLKKKAKRDIKSIDGKTAVDFARETGDRRMRELFGID
ncbi:MAG: ankyrin repeat domain-containing protein [Spirochaetes bacterium]|nr:ankyrin repeat domain-containing protein [Spirochaetota bacterium]